MKGLSGCCPDAEPGRSGGGGDSLLPVGWSSGCAMAFTLPNRPPEMAAILRGFGVRILGIRLAVASARFVFADERR